MFVRNFLFIAAGLMILASCNQKSGKKADLKTNVDSVSYSMGVSTGMYFQSAGLDSVNAEAFTQAVLQVIKKDSNLLIKPDKANEYLQAYFMKKQQKKFEKNIDAGKAFLDENKKKQGVVTTASGLQYLILKEGKGESPKATDVVSVFYKGTLIDGSVFDATDKEPVEFPVNKVIPGWTEALQLMKTGSKFQVFIPYNLAYGERGAGQQIQPYSTLIFEVELVAINPPAKDNNNKDNKKGKK